MAVQENPPKRDPREPTPLVLMNPELRIRQLRYAANIEASLMVPLHRYYEVLLDLSWMGLEYLKSMKLERAFIIFKRIEYFIHHRLCDHPGIETFSSASKDKIMNRLPMIMYVAQQIIIDFVMPVYERQAAYFRYEELQRRLKILNAQAWQSIMVEAARREAEFYAEAEAISTRFGVELASFLPQQVIPDHNHPTNYPPRTFPTKSTTPSNKSHAADREAMQVAINEMNQSLSLSYNSREPVADLIMDINKLMNTALAKFFRTRNLVLSDGQSTSADIPVNSAPSTSDLALVLAQDSDNHHRSLSPSIEHMYSVPPNPPASEPYIPPINFGETTKRMVYNPKYSLDTYVELLTKTFETNSETATGYRPVQRTVLNTESPSTVGFMVHLLPVDAFPTVSLVDGTSSSAFKTIASRMIPEPDPGPPKANPPVQPDTFSSPEHDTFGVWTKKGKAFGPDGVGSLGVLSHLDRAREVLDARPPMPAGINQVGADLLVDNSRKRGVGLENQDTPRKRREFIFNEPGPSSRATTTTNTYPQFQQ